MKRRTRTSSASAASATRSCPTTSRSTVRSRFVWLAVNLITAILASSIINVFDGAIEKMVALAVLMPIVASMGGNAGTQTMTVTVRALATGDLDIYNAFRVIRREASVGFLNGILFAIIMGAIATVWFHDFQLGIVIAAAMIINLVAAALGGILLPLVLHRFGADRPSPRRRSSPRVTDCTRYFPFLGLATWWFAIH